MSGKLRQGLSADHRARYARHLRQQRRQRRLAFEVHRRRPCSYKLHIAGELDRIVDALLRMQQNGLTRKITSVPARLVEVTLFLREPLPSPFILQPPARKISAQ